jgi:hypothetical protein
LALDRRPVIDLHLHHCALCRADLANLEELCSALAEALEESRYPMGRLQNGRK